MEKRLSERAEIILGCVRGEQVKDIAAVLGIRPNTVIMWRDRFLHGGIDGFFDLPRTGKPPSYAEEFRAELLATLELPPLGQARWDGPALAKHLNASPDAVWRVLRKEGIHLSRRRGVFRPTRSLPLWRSRLEPFIP